MSLKKYAVFDGSDPNSFLNNRNIKTLENKINPSNVNDDQGYILYLACKYNLFKLVKLLLKNGVDIDTDNYKCIKICIEHKHYSLLLYICKNLFPLEMSLFIDFVVASDWTVSEKECVKNALHVIRNGTTTVIDTYKNSIDNNTENNNNNEDNMELHYLNSRFDLECKICLKKYNTNCVNQIIPYTSSCGHTFCQGCIYLIDKCGICRQDIYQRIRLYL